MTPLVEKLYGIMIENGLLRFEAAEECAEYVEDNYYSEEFIYWLITQKIWKWNGRSWESTTVTGIHLKTVYQYWKIEVKSKT